MWGRPWAQERYWREYVHAQSGVLQQQLESLLARLDDKERAAKRHLREAVTCELRNACQAAGGWLDDDQPPDKTVVNRRSRVTVEGAFQHLHAAERMLVELYSIEEIEARIPYVITRLRTCLGPRSHLPPAVETQFAQLRRHRNEKALRAVFSDAMHAAYTASDEQHMLLKQLRPIIYLGAAIMTALAIGVSVIGFYDRQIIPLCFAPNGPEQLVCPTGIGGPFRLDVALTAFLGLLGGALSAAVAIRHLRGSTPPYGLSVALSLLKLPAGALTAVAGLLLVHGRFVPGLSDLDTPGQILAYAVVLGFAQQVATQFVDRRAREVMSRTPGRDPMSAPVNESPPPASSDAHLAWATWSFWPTEPSQQQSRRAPKDHGEPHEMTDITTGHEANGGDGSSPPS